MSYRENLKYWMDKKNISMNQLSKETGIGQSTLSEFLSGKLKDTTTEKAMIISNALGISISELLCEANDNEPDEMVNELINILHENQEGLLLLQKIKNNSINIKIVEAYVDGLIKNK